MNKEGFAEDGGQKKKAGFVDGEKCMVVRRKYDVRWCDTVQSSVLGPSQNPRAVVTQDQ